MKIKKLYLSIFFDKEEKMETIPDKLLLEIYHQARLYKLSNDFIELLEKEIVARKLMDRVIDKKLS